MRTMEKNFNGITRRTFVKGIGAGAALTFGLGILPKIANSKIIGNVPPYKLVWSIPSPFEGLDPHTAGDDAPYSFKMNLYGQLFRYQDSPPKLVPWVAKGYEADQNGEQFTVYLKPGLKFHDGNEITAEDVRFSVERCIEMKKQVGGMLSPILNKDSVKVIDNYTCKFNLRKACGYFLAALPTLAIVNSKLLRQHDKDGDYGAAWLTDHEAGSGAYMLKNWDFTSGWTGVQWPDWAGGWAGNHLKEISFNTIIEVASRISALIKGETNALELFVPPDQLEKLKRDPNIKVIPNTSLTTFFIRLNYIRPPTSNIHYRKALSYAFPYDAFIDKVMQKNVVRSDGGPLPNKMWGWPKDLKIYKTDMAKAKEEIAIAKKELAPEDFNREVTVKAIKGYGSTKLAALYLSDAARELGLKFNVVEEPWTVLSSAAREKNTTHDIWMHWRNAHIVDPITWIGRLYTPEYQGAFDGGTFYDNPEVTLTLMKAGSSIDQAERQSLYEKACRLIVEDAADIWISNEILNGVFTADVHGWRYCDVAFGFDAYSMYRE
jgi:peptide/nickel transport system substrate-binding protein